MEEKEWTWRGGGQKKRRTKKNWGEEWKSRKGEGVDMEMRRTREEKDEEELRRRGEE